MKFWSNAYPANLKNGSFGQAGHVVQITNSINMFQWELFKRNSWLSCYPQLAFPSKFDFYFITNTHTKMHEAFSYPKCEHQITKIHLLPNVSIYFTFLWYYKKIESMQLSSHKSLNLQCLIIIILIIIIQY